MRRVAHEDDIAVRPRCILDRDEVAPHRAVLEQPMSLQLFLEQSLTERDGFVFARLVETRFAPRRLRRLDDEGRVSVLVLIGVHAPQAMLVALEVEREGGEGARRAEPHESVRALIHARLEVIGIGRADDAVEAIGGDDEIGVGVGPGIDHLRADLEADPQRPAPDSEHLEQRLAREPAEPVSSGGDHEAAVVDVDVVPVREVAGHRVVRLGIGRGEVVLRRVGEDDAEAERILEPVALENGDLVAGMRLLHQDAEIEGRGPAPDADDLHLMSCPAIIRCWISVVPS